MPKKQYKLPVQGRECFSRMNFLYQAALLMAGQNDTLSAYYGQLCRSIGKKSTLRIEPNIKRDFCKRCSLALKPGITSHINAKKLSNSNKMQVVEEIRHTCNLCGYQKRLQVNPNYQFWLDNAESVAEIYIISEKLKH